jgi:hypothetical protein
MRAKHWDDLLSDDILYVLAILALFFFKFLWYAVAAVPAAKIEMLCVINIYTNISY